MKTPVFSIVRGGVSSAGTLISVVCEKRFIGSNSFMQIHQNINDELAKKVSEVEDKHHNMQLLLNHAKKFYKKYTKLSDSTLDNLLFRDLWLDCNKCLEYGLVDEII